MSVRSHFHMPGAFHGEGVHPGLFRPPLSSKSSANNCQPQLRTASFETHAKRKRNEISKSQENLAHVNDAGEHYFTPMDEKRYYLAGELDTPFGESGGMGESMYSDSDYRRALGSKRARDDAMDLDGEGPTQLFNLPPQPTLYKGWGAFAFSAIGGVFGKVMDFCRIGSFKGFQAGGGQKFEVTQHGIAEVPTFFEGPQGEDQQMQDQQQQLLDRPPQASYYIPDPEEDYSRSSTPSRPAAKRTRTEHQDDLGRNWVMVEPSEKKPYQRRVSRPNPRSRNQALSMSASRRMAPPLTRLSTSSHASQTRRSRHSLPAYEPLPKPPAAPVHEMPVFDTPRPSTAASFASPRSTPSKIPQPVSTGHRRRSSLAPSPAISAAVAAPTVSTPSPSVHRRSRSNASTASPRGATPNTSFSGIGSQPRNLGESSPRLDKEAQQLAARRKMDDRDADVRIAQFNKRLQDMIRQGKEALGTTIEVEGCWEDD